MAINYTMTVEDGILSVKASGFDESLAEVEQYGMAVIRETKKTGVRKVLCDELDLQYRLMTFDTFAAAEFIVENAPEIAANGRVAIVCNPRDIEDAVFFENIVVNRGMTLCVFKDTERARTWLSELI
jgi:hypothetical protein